MRGTRARPRDPAFRLSLDERDASGVFAVDMARELFDSARVIRTWTTHASFAAAEEAERAAYRAMSPRQRLLALELMRQLNHSAYDPDSRGLPRVYSITQRPSG